MLGIVGASTDTSVTWTIVKHVHSKLTEGDARPCALLNSAQRALETRCGAFAPGSIVAGDIAQAGYAECPLTLAARDPALWPVLPELLDKGARTASCTESPLAQLARRESLSRLRRAHRRRRCGPWPSSAPTIRERSSTT